MPESTNVNSLLFPRFNSFLVRNNHMTGHVTRVSEVKGIPLTTSSLRNKVLKGQVAKQDPYLCVLASIVVDFSLNKRSLRMFKDIKSVYGVKFPKVFKG